METSNLAKITRPQVGRVYERERLFTALDALEEQGGVWISAPGGSGKTTLIVSHLQSKKLPALWYKIDAGDNDPASFFYYMGLAAGKAAPRRRKPLPVLTPEYLGGLPTFSRNFFRVLFSRLQSPSLFVLDNYQEVPLQSPLHGLLAEALAEIPAGVRPVICSRSDPPYAFSRLCAKNSLSVFGWEDMKLTRDECVAVTQLRTGKELISRDEAKSLCDVTGGWMTGLILMLEEADGGKVQCSLDNPKSQQKVFDYFAGEILLHMDEGLQDFLLKTSQLSEIDVKTAALLTDNPEAEKILKGLARRNYFTYRHAGTAGTFEFHPLFRHFLRQETRNRYSATERNRLQTRAGKLLEQAGRFEEAAALYMESASHEDLTALILQKAENLLRQGRNQVLNDWLQALPSVFLEQIPWLRYWLGMAHIFTSGPPVAREGFSRAFYDFRKSDDSIGAYLAWAAIVDTIWFEMGDMSRLDEWIQCFDNPDGDFSEQIPRQVQDIATKGFFHALLVRQPDNPRLAAWVKRASSVARNNPGTQVGFELAVFLSLYFIWTGDMQRASFFGRSLKMLSAAAESPPVAKICSFTQSAILAWMDAAGDECLAYVHQGLEDSVSFGISVYTIHLCGAGFHGALCTDDRKTAASFLEKMEAGQSHLMMFDRAYYHSLKSWYSLLQGDLLRAADQGGQALECALYCGVPFLEASTRMGLSYLSIAQKDFAAAEEHLARISTIAVGMKSNILLAQYHICQAHLADLQGNPSDRAKHLQQGLSLMRKQGYVNFPFWLPGVLSRLCSLALDDGIEVSYVTELIKQRNLAPDANGIISDTWPWPVKVHTLGRFGLMLDGKEMHLPGKARQRPLALLKALIALGGRKISETKIADALWPDVDGDVQIQSLHTTLHRLRKQLGSKEAITYSDGSLTINARYVWVDVWAFFRLAAEIETSCKYRGASADCSRLAEKLRRSYSGDFLPDNADTGWSIALREQLHNRYLRVVKMLAGVLADQGLWQEAADLYEKALIIDPLVESLYQELMRCYQKLDRRGAARQTYNRCAKTLRSAFSVEPSPATKQLYERINGQ